MGHMVVLGRDCSSGVGCGVFKRRRERERERERWRNINKLGVSCGGGMGHDCQDVVMKAVLRLIRVRRLAAREWLLVWMFYAWVGFLYLY